MNTLRTFLLTLLLVTAGCATRPADKPEVSGGMSHHFAMKLTYEPATGTNEAHFVITLSNTSGKDWEVELGEKNFDGTIFIEKPPQKPTEYYPQRFRNLRLTSQWGYPKHIFQAGRSVIWKVPINDLRTLHDEPIAVADVADSTVHAELPLLTVFPARPHRVITNNGRQMTPKIKL